MLNDIIDMDINGMYVSHCLINGINHFETRKDRCIGFGRTYQAALQDLHDKIIKKTLSKSQKENEKTHIA